MFLRKLSKNIATRSFRLLSCLQVSPLVDVSVDSEGIATVQLQRLPVNSLNLELLQELHTSIYDLEKSKCKGMVLTSASPTYFSAGVDLNEFYKPDTERLTLLSNCIIDIVAKVFGTDIITTVAINGYTGAGALILAIACDYRAMTTGQAIIGINDTAVGIPPGMWIYELMTRLTSPKLAEYALTSSVMFPAERAFQVGLIDDIATDKRDAIKKFKGLIRTYDHISPVIRATTKRAIRKDFLTKFENNRNTYVEGSLALAMSPEISIND